MAIVIQREHDILVHEVAEDYIAQGYSVLIEPRNGELPDFLNGYRPDLIVTTPDEKIVVEVKTAGRSRDAAYFEDLTRRIAAHPGWRFEFRVNNRRIAELTLADTPTYSTEELAERLNAASKLMSQGLLDSALLLAWSVIEGSLWKYAREKGVYPRQVGGAILAELANKELISRDAYASLSAAIRLRDMAAHGLAMEDLSTEQLSMTINYAQKLLATGKI